MIKVTLFLIPSILIGLVAGELSCEGLVPPGLSVNYGDGSKSYSLNAIKTDLGYFLITLEGIGSNSFSDFIIQARPVFREYVLFGQFEAYQGVGKAWNCMRANDTAINEVTTTRSKVIVKWIPPPNEKYSIKFFASVIDGWWNYGGISSGIITYGE